MPAFALRLPGPSNCLRGLGLFDGARARISIYEGPEVSSECTDAYHARTPVFSFASERDTSNYGGRSESVCHKDSTPPVRARRDPHARDGAPKYSAHLLARQILDAARKLVEE